MYVYTYISVCVLGTERCGSKKSIILARGTIILLIIIIHIICYTVNNMVIKTVFRFTKDARASESLFSIKLLPTPK